MEVVEIEICTRIYIYSKGSHLCRHDGLLNICLKFLVPVNWDIMVCLFLSYEVEKCNCLVKEYVESDIFGYDGNL